MATQLPLFQPPSDWVMPDQLPDLRHAKEIAIDTETKDPNLTSMGSGCIRRDGHIAGYAIAVDGASYYLPVRHEEGPNLDPHQIRRYMSNLCADPDRTYVFHNAPYDIGWLHAEGIDVKGSVVDTMVAAPLLDENRFSYRLDALGKDYLGDRKDERLLREAARDWGLNAKSEMHKLPAMYVGSYAEQDAALTLRLYQYLRQRIIAEELSDVFDLETRVQRITIQMRRRGVRLDLEYAHTLKTQFSHLERTELHAIGKDHGYGRDIEVWSAASVAALFDHCGLEYPRTKEGAPSFTKEWLNAHEHPVAKQVVRVRKLSKASGTFIDAYLKHQINGRIHPEIHALRGDEGGTVTGRFSYSDPNLQQVPSPDKDPELAPLVRGLFLPEPEERWGAFDYSSQEPRLLVHYAALMDIAGARDVRDRYNTDPLTDLHQWCADIMGIPRKSAKAINLGIMYGMGKNKLAAQLGVSFDAASSLMGEYHVKVPFVKGISDECMDRASKKGVIRTLLGRRCRFDLWEPMSYGLHKALPHKEAYAEHGAAIKRAYTYRALNRLIQGSAADQTKKAMVTVYEEFGYLPLLQVHDELDYSVSSRDQARNIIQVMENCVSLEVPSGVDAEFGPSWGKAKEKLEGLDW
jgi:DNA polymerase I-like protein with 3'-5' exonuclease and polymerase domains